MDFFKPEQIGSRLFYVSGYSHLETDKLKGLIGLLRDVIREHRATMLVIDGLVTVGDMAESDLEMKKFVHELQTLVELVGCTTLLLTGARLTDGQYPQRTMVDGLLHLSLEPAGMAAIRTLEVAKFRGSEVLLGRHIFEISGHGITVFPRVEAWRGRAVSPLQAGRPLLGSGIESLDAMLGGGLRSGSVTLALGAPGSGKTLLGLAFLAAGARAGEPGVYFGFSESARELIGNADAVGMDFSRFCQEGLIEVLWYPPFELAADALAEKVLAAVEGRRAHRVFIDGIAVLKESIFYTERTGRFFSALCNELRGRGVTTVLSDETEDRIGPTLEIPTSRLTPMIDNVISLRIVERGTRLHRILSVAKMRSGPSDPTLREFSISSRGIDVSTTLQPPARLLPGRATPGRPAPSPPSKGAGQRRSSRASRGRSPKKKA
jgi:circadian clock protein KaiC